jgi:hypothetical protein
MILAVDEKGRRVCIRGVFSRFLGMARENMKDGFWKVCWGE